MLKLIAIVGGLAAVGGLIGFSGVLCPDGSCAITGSWYGGATVGGLLGYGVFVGFASGGVKPTTPSGEDAPTEETP